MKGLGLTATVTMYSRKRCGLCDRAREVIVAERARTAFDFSEIFIDGDERLEGDYGVRVPVVLVNGEEAFECWVDATAFAQALRSV